MYKLSKKTIKFGPEKKIGTWFELQLSHSIIQNVNITSVKQKNNKNK